MIQNLLHTPSRTTETNSGMIKGGTGKESGKEKEGLFKKLFENLQNSGEKGEVGNKPEGEIKKEEAKSTESEKSTVKKESATNVSEKSGGSERTAEKSEQGENSAEKSTVSGKNNQTVSIKHADDDTVKQSAADTKIGEQKESLSSKEETILKTGSRNQAEQQDVRAGSESTESKQANAEGKHSESTESKQANAEGKHSESTESKPANAEGQHSEGGEGEKKVAVPSGTPGQQGEHVSNEPLSESGVQDNSRAAENSSKQTHSATQNDQGSGKGEAVNMAGSLNTQGTGETISTEAASSESGKSEVGNRVNTTQTGNQEGTISKGLETAESGKSEAEHTASTPQSESQGVTTSTKTESAEASRPSESQKIAFEAMSASSQERSVQMKAQSGSEKQAANASHARPNPVPVTATQGVEGAKPEANTMSPPEQAAKLPSELGAASKSAKPVPGESMLTEKESGNRTDTPLRDTGNIIARMVMGQMHGGGVAAGPNAQTPQAAEFTRNAQAFVKANGQMADADRSPEPALIREELQKGSLNKPEFFSISSDIKKVFNQKNKSQDERGRLDVDKLSMRAGESNRAPVLDMENMQFGSSGQQAMKWDWSAGSQSSSDKAEDSVTFKKFTPEFSASKEVDSADQKNTNYTSLASVTISNISVKRNVLPGLSQVVLSSAAGKSSPESWNKHSFVLEDGSKIQFSSRKLDGVIQLKIGSTTPELNRLLQQHQNDIIQHLKKESELEIDLQFDNSGEESGFESFEDQNPASKSPQIHQTNGIRESAAGPKEYVSGRKIRTFGYNNMEWTA